MKNSLFIILLLLPQLARSMPSLTNRCGERGISFTPPDNTSLVTFNENCDTAFIGPPANGKVSVDQVMGSMNLLFCETVKILPKTVEAARKGMQFWVNRLVQRSQEYDEVSNEVIEYGKNLAKLKPQLDNQKKILEIREEEFKVAKTKVMQTKGQLEDCSSSSVEASLCDKIRQDLKKDIEIASIKRGLVSDTEIEIIDLEFKIKKDEGLIREINERIEHLNADLIKYKNMLKMLENDALEGYERYGQLHGATVTLNFHADWQNLVIQAQVRNSGLHIEQMPLIGSIVSVSSSMPDGFGIKNMSTLLGARVPGFDSYSVREPQKIDLGREISSHPVPWVTSVSGQIDFNLIGACVMVDSQNKISTSKANEAVESALVINLQHIYPMMMKRNYEINFNTTKITSEIERLAESGGFFSSKKLHELVKHNLSSDVFNITFSDQGGHTGYTEEEKRIIKEDAKYEIVDKILSGMNAIPQYSNERPPPPRLDRSSGARFIYANMPCFGYAVCYATGFIIGVADAIFGSKESVSKFTKVNGTNVRHRYTERSPGYRITTTTFKGDGI